MGMGMGSSLDALMLVEFSDNSDVYIIVVNCLKDYLSWSKHKTAVCINIQLTKKILRPSPLFCLASNAFPDVGSVGRIKKKKKKKLKKNHNKSRNRRPWYPRMTLKVNIYIFGLTKCTIYCKKCSCFSLCYADQGFFPGTPVFPSPQKPTISNSNSTRNQVDEEPQCGCANSKYLFIYLFIYFAHF